MSRSTDLVSVILTTHNCEKIVTPTINSIIHQTYSNWELIVVDDASSDNTVEKLYSLLKSKANNPFYIYQNNINRNVSYSRNRGISHAKGRFLAFIDHDDIWLEDKLKIQVSFHQDNKAFLSHTYYRHFNENKIDQNLITSNDFIMYKDLLKQNSIALSSVMIDQNIEKNFQFVEENKNYGAPQEDFRTWLFYSKKGLQMRIIKKDLMRYFFSTVTSSSNKWKMAKRRLNILFYEERLNLAKIFYYFIIYIFRSLNKYYIKKI